MRGRLHYNKTRDCFRNLRDSYGNLLKGNPKIWGAPVAQGHTHFSSRCDFMMGLGKPKLCTIFEVASFSRCRNIKGDPKIFGSSPSPGPHPFLCWWDLMMGLGKPQLLAKFEVSGFSYCGNIREFVFKQICFF